MSKKRYYLDVSDPLHRVYSTCSNCFNRAVKYYRWQKDSPFGGPIYLVCDKCEKKSIIQKIIKWLEGDW